ncbi:MAG TPA: DUF3822 family protein [Moheibacter sp.]|nr:DUF3822 family protein [Moheibacter sp.]
MNDITTHTSSLNLLFFKEGFSYCIVSTDNERPKVHTFQVKHLNQWEKEVIQELEVNLHLRRNFGQVNVGFLTSFFNLVPTAYESLDAETLLNFSEATFENNALLKSETINGALKIVYGTSQLLIDGLKKLHQQVNFYPAAQVFYAHLVYLDKDCIHLNWQHQHLEIMVTQDKQLIFYNVFETASDEDVLFYTLFALEQLGLKANQIQLNTYGALLPETRVFQLLKKYVRYVNAALKDEEVLANFTLYKLNSCGSSLEVSKEKES